MNMDNNNLENGIGSESLGAVETPVNAAPINNETVNNVGDATFNPFEDLNNAQLNVPTEPVEEQPTPIVQTEPIDAQPTLYQPEPVQDLTAPVEAPVQTEVPAASFNQTAPYGENINVNNQAPVDNFQQPSFEPTNAEPVVDTFNQAPAVEPVMPSEPVMDTNVAPEVAPMPAPETLPQQPVTDGPTLPIPDQMPTTDYQAGVSTPVDYATPMSDFDQIGTTPELDPKAKTKKSKKLSIFLLLLLLIAALGGGSYYLINIKGIFNSNSVSVKEVTAEKGEALSTNIDDYATFKNTSSSNCSLDTSKVVITTPGTYEYTISCGDKTYKGKVVVKDTKGPQIDVKTNIVVAGTNLTADMLVASSDETATYAYESENETQNFQTAGLKNLKVVATDEAGNKKTYTIPVVVTSAEYSMGIVSIKKIGTDKTDVNIAEKNVILYNNTAGIVNDTSYTAYVITFANNQTFKNAIKDYNNSGSFTYETYTGTPLFYNSLNTLVLVKDINSDLIKDDYTQTFNNVNNQNGYQAILVNQTLPTKDLLNFEIVK